MKTIYKTHGTCSTFIEVTTENDCVEEVRFIGGCNGNLKGIAALVKGLPVAEVIRRLEGIRCGARATSCPDQLCQALKQQMAENS